MNNGVDPEPRKNAPTGGELFVGLNILSKIGVIFIIVGFLAFTAASYDMPGVLRMAMMFALGAVMAGAGELFYRKGSVVFARALTLGAVADWAIAVPVSRFSFHAMSVVFALVAAVICTAVSLFLAVRYKSRTVLISALVCAFIPFFAVIDSAGGYFAGMAYIIAVQTATVIISRSDRYFPGAESLYVPIIGIFCNIAASFASLFCADSIFDTDVSCVAAGAVYMALSFGMYSAFSAVRCYKDGGKLSKHGVPLIMAQTMALVLSSILSRIFAGRLVCGIIMAAYCAVYLAAAICLALSKKRKTGLAVFAENLFLVALTIALFSLVVGRFAYMAYHVFAAALYIWGVWRNDKVFKTRGLITLGFSEGYFLFVCVLNSSNPVFFWQFTLNVILWLGIMAVLAVKGARGAWLTTLSCLSLANTSIWGVYIVVKLAEQNPHFGGAAGSALATSVFLLVGFAAGKLKFIDIAAPVASIFFYCTGLICVFVTNLINAHTDGFVVSDVITVCAMNIASVLCVLDMALRIRSFAPRFARAVGLVTSAFALYSLTAVLDGNGWVAFTSCIISIVYIAVAAVWIVVGFKKNNALMRRFGLALSLFASAKLFLFDFGEIGTSGRMLMCIGFGITLLCISFAYGYFSKKLKGKG